MSRNGASDDRRGGKRTFQSGRRRRMRPTVLVLEDRRMLTSYIVNSPSDSSSGSGLDGSLRYVISQLDSAGVAPNTITFAIGSGVQTITPATPLPTIVKPVTITGTTAEGVNDAPLIVINGGSAGSTNGLTLAAGSSGSVIQSLVIDGFSGNGIEIESADDTVTGCYIGTDSTGGLIQANHLGISVDATGAGATIGGTSAGMGNVISGNRSYGVYIDATGLIEGNDVGTNQSGLALPNEDGIAVEASGATIGGTSAGAGNVISDNSNLGVYINAPCLVAGNTVAANEVDGAYVDTSGTDAIIGGSSSGASNVISGNLNDGIYIGASCLVEGNDIGTNSAGSVLPNYDGIDVEASGATIGGSSSGDGNVISGNAGDGIYIGASCLVEGNKIGTKPSGTAAMANGAGIGVFGSGATIGGSSSGDGNVISGNSKYGIDIGASCLVVGNEIGTNPSGTAAVANTTGIHVGASGAMIGGSASGDGNVISGNSKYGIDIEASCLVEGNLIGITAAGTALANSDGISVGGSGATIGGTTSGAANVISGNTYDGIVIGVSCLVEGNEIGTDATGTNPVPNQGIGVFIVTGSAVATTIGVAGAANTIAFNGGPGVVTVPGTADSTIRFNSIFDNGGPGIDRNHDGVTANTPDGPNNTPVLTSAGDTIITGTLNASPDSTYIVDFYANPSSDASPARPQGRSYLGSTTVATNAQGNVGFDSAYTPIGGEPVVTATATDVSGTTSEFSAPMAFAVAASGLTINATAGVPFQGVVASFTSSDLIATAADFQATINVSDGTSLTGTVEAAPGGFVVVGPLTFPTANPAEAFTVTITDELGLSQATANSLADVTSPGDVLKTFPQTATFVAGTLYSAVVAAFTDSSSLAVPGEFTAMINWGDGTASSVGTIAVSGGGYSVTGSHTYNLANTVAISEPVTVTITDTLTLDSVTADSTANVTPVPITVQPRNFAVTGGTAFTGTVATFIDGDPRINPGF
jgi:hypothetical protein